MKALQTKLEAILFVASGPLEIKKIAREAELIFKKEFSAGGHHFALLFSK